MESNTSLIPQFLTTDLTELISFPVDVAERKIMGTAKKLFHAEFYPQCLLETWNAAVNNLRRRVEAYGVELFISVIKSEPGRKNYNVKGDTLGERWENVDDYLLIVGARKLGLINKKGAKTLEMINWMRNHASSAHSSEEEASRNEVISFVALLEENLFKLPLPNPGHSIASLFEPIKNKDLDFDQIESLKDQIRSYKQEDLRTCYGFLLDSYCEGTEPKSTNAQKLLPLAWELINDDLKRSTGFRYHGYDIDSTSDDSPDNGAKTRLLEFLVEVEGIKFIPDGTRARIYRKLAYQLHNAKDTSYGFNQEVQIAKTLQQFGVYVPSVVFEELYQEILAVCCGNFWKRSSAYLYLEDDFILKSNNAQLRAIVKLFKENERVQEELFQQKPKQQAIKILNKIKSKFVIEANKAEVDDAIKYVKDL